MGPIRVLWAVTSLHLRVGDVIGLFVKVRKRGLNMNV